MKLRERYFRNLLNDLDLIYRHDYLLKYEGFRDVRTNFEEHFRDKIIDYTDMIASSNNLRRVFFLFQIISTFLGCFGILLEFFQFPLISLDPDIALGIFWYSFPYIIQMIFAVFWRYWKGFVKRYELDKRVGEVLNLIRGTNLPEILKKLKKEN